MVLKKEEVNIITEENYETVELDISYEDYYTLNERARKKNLLLDDFITEILAEYIKNNPIKS